MDNRTGFALCGAGEPNLQFPLGSAILGQGNQEEIVTCYKCLKLDYINSLDDKQSIPTKDFIPTDKTPKKTSLSPQEYSDAYDRRRQHVMIPFGVEGLFGQDLELDKVNEEKIVSKMIERIKATEENIDKRKEYITVVTDWEDFYADLRVGDSYALEIWTKFSPFRVGNKKNKEQPKIRMRTQTDIKEDPVEGKLAKIKFSTIEAVPSESKESVDNRRKRSKDAKMKLITIGIRMLDLIKKGEIDQVRELAKRKDKIGSLAKRVLTTQNEKELRMILQRTLQTGTKNNPNLMLENDSMAEFETDHQRHKKRIRQRVKRKRR